MFGRLALLRFLLAVLFLTPVGCEQESPTVAFDIELVPDPTVNTVDQVLERIDTLTLVVDNEEGLYETGSERLGGAVEIKNVDSDDALEITASVSIENDRLPLVRLEQGGLADLLLDIRALGWLRAEEDGTDFPPAQVIAEGQVFSITFEGGVQTLSIPFNIRPELLPPRVNDVIPGDGESIEGHILNDLVILFSKPMDAARLRAPGALELEPPGTIQEVITDASGLVAHLKVEGITGDETLTYRLTVTTSVTDEQGIALDQLPTVEGAQAFESEATVDCIMGPDTPEPPPCSELAPEGHCPIPAFYECVDGECQLEACEFYDCAEGLTCNPSTGTCEVDCRPYGDLNVCPPEQPRCSPDTGLCES